jgi:hypothetical protein
VTRFPTIAAALLALGGAALSPASGAVFFHGKYTVTYFSGPNHTESDQLCVAFVHTGGVAGFADSGTWTARKLAKDLGGNFTVDQNVLRFYAAYEGGTNVLNHFAAMTGTTGAGGFDQWDRSVSPPAPIADGTIQITKGCA